MDEFDQMLIDIIKNEHPETLEEAIKLARSKHSITEGIIEERILRLENEEKIFFEKPQVTFPSSFLEYLFSGWSWRYWIVFGLATVASAMVFLVPEDSFPLVYAKYLFGSIAVLFLPGYSLVEVLQARREVDLVERVTLSIGLSLALVPMTGLLLSYSPWGITVAPVTFCLLALTLMFLSAAAVQGYRGGKRMRLTKPRNQH